MIFFIILGLVIIISTITYFSTHRSIETLMLNIGIGLIISLILSFFGGAALGDIHDTHDVVTSKSEIAALSNSSKKEGTFFLGIGSMEENPTYYYMEKTDDGLELRNVNPLFVSIKETNEVSPNITYYDERFDNETLDWLFGSSSSKQIIHLPEGSVKKDFNVDLDDY